MPSDDDPLLRFGLTDDELRVWYELAAVAGRMLNLPEQHPMERRETAAEFHVLQNRLLARAGMRSQRSYRPPSSPNEPSPPGITGPEP